MTDEMIEQCENLHENDEHQKIIQLISEIPEKERGYQLTSILARAYNNESQFEEAVRLLLSVQEEGQYDILWHFRLGYAYYYLGQFEESKTEFERVLESDPEDEDAQMFLQFCISELENNKPFSSLKDRVSDFWEWFTQNEEYLSDIITNRDKHDTNEVVVFISHGVQLISNDIHFNIGGNYELTFSASGRYYLFYLLPYLASRLPEQFQDKWKVFPYMQGTGGENFGFGMFGQTIDTDEVMVKADYVPQNDNFILSFYNKPLFELDESDCYNAFYIMMEITIGEGLAHIYVNIAKKADSLEDDMIPLTKLEAFIKESISKKGKEIVLRPDERYSSYEFQPQENDELRYDVIVGVSSFFFLIADYYNESTETMDDLNAGGIKAMFLAFPYDDDDRSSILDTRYEIEERLEKEVFGIRGTGKESGIVIGGSMGTSTVYIDLLLYDGFDSLDRISELLRNYPYDFYLSEFRQHSPLIPLFDEKE